MRPIRTMYYAGWKDAYLVEPRPGRTAWTLERTDNIGKQSGQEIFMRHRSPLMRVELDCIPKGFLDILSRPGS